MAMRKIISFRNQSHYYLRLKKLEEVYANEDTLKAAVYAGSAVVADQIRENLEKLPEQQFQRLPNGEVFKGVSQHQKEDLLKGFGLTPIERDKSGFVHTKAGFEEYGKFPTPSYPKGIPNALLARAIESGSSVHQKTPFIEPAVKATRQKAIAAMEEVIDEQMKDIFEGG